MYSPCLDMALWFLCFFLNVRMNPQSDEADADTVLRTLMMKTFRPDIPCIVQLHNTHNLSQVRLYLVQLGIFCGRASSPPPFWTSRMMTSFSMLLPLIHGDTAAPYGQAPTHHMLRATQVVHLWNDCSVSHNLSLDHNK